MRVNAASAEVPPLLSLFPHLLLQRMATLSYSHQAIEALYALFDNALAVTLARGLVPLLSL
jgi:hypothetical protein